MTQITGRTTVKITLEGPSDLVNAITYRINRFFTVTYVSKDKTRPLNDGHISRFLRVIPPDQAHRSHHSLESRPGSPGPGQETTET